MRPFAMAIVLGVCSVGCAPSASDLVGRYTVGVSETIDACSGGSPRPTALLDITEVAISERTNEYVYVELGPCGFVATVTDKFRFEAEDASCHVEYESPGITITFSATGVLEDRVLDLTLTGTYQTTQYGYPVECDYSFHASG